MLHRLLIAVLILVLHLPLLYYALRLYPRLGAGQTILDLGPATLLALLVLLLLPYTVLALGGVRWNPERARLGEPDT